jgi:hypothetical protein
MIQGRPGKERIENSVPAAADPDRAAAVDSKATDPVDTVVANLMMTEVIVVTGHAQLVEVASRVEVRVVPVAIARNQTEKEVSVVLAGLAREVVVAGLRAEVHVPIAIGIGEDQMEKEANAPVGLVQVAAVASKAKALVRTTIVDAGLKVTVVNVTAKDHVQQAAEVGSAAVAVLIVFGIVKKEKAIARGQHVRSKNEVGQIVAPKEAAGSSGERNLVMAKEIPSQAGQENIQDRSGRKLVEKAGMNGNQGQTNLIVLKVAGSATLAIRRMQRQDLLFNQKLTGRKYRWRRRKNLLQHLRADLFV